MAPDLTLNKSWKTLDQHIRESPNGADDAEFGCAVGVDDYTSNTLGAYG